MSFGLFNSDNPYVPYTLTTVALAAIIVFSVALWRSNSLVYTAGFAAIIGGALSNVVGKTETVQSEASIPVHPGNAG